MEQEKLIHVIKLIDNRLKSLEVKVVNLQLSDEAKQNQINRLIQQLDAANEEIKKLKLKI